MVKVATSIDAPIKILFPKSKYLFLNNSHGFALLGGGDIIVPGLWCGLCLRYDWCVLPYFPPCPVLLFLPGVCKGPARRSQRSTHSTHSTHKNDADCRYSTNRSSPP